MADHSPAKPDATFEREKWEVEVRLREREVAIKERDAAAKDREYELKLRELDAKVADQRRATWTSPLVLALVAATVAALGNAGIAFLNGRAQVALESTKADTQRALEETKAEVARILEVIKTDTESAAKNLDFLVKAGLITNPVRKAALESFLKERQPGEGPSTLPSAVATFEPPHYNLPAPAPNASLSAVANRMVALAVGEINQNVEENTSFERVREYWKAVPGSERLPMEPNTPWTAAFVSWIIHQAGGGNALRGSAASLDIWNDAVKKGLTFAPGKKMVLPGDIVLISRGSSVNDARMSAIRAGTVRNEPAQMGIVYAVTGETFTSIEGNVGNAVRLRDHSMKDRIIGFIRLTDG